MDLKPGEIYLIFERRNDYLLGGEFIKFISFKDEWVNFISNNMDVNKIKDVEVDDREKYLIKIIRRIGSGEVIMNYEALELELEDKIFDLFSSYREEIELDYDGDEETFLRSRRWCITYETPNEYKYKQLKKDYFFNKYFIIPYYEAVEKYPYIFSRMMTSVNDYTSVPFLNRNESRIFLRDYTVDSLLT